MKNPMKIAMICLMALSPLFVVAQSEKAVDQALSQALKSVSMSDVSIPGVDAASVVGNSALESLSDAVGDAVTASLESGEAANLWSTEGLDAMALGKLKASESPFTTLLSLKGDGARAELESLITDQLQATGAMEMLEQADGLTGFTSAAGDLDKGSFVKSLTDNTLNVLDMQGAKMMKKIVN